MTTPTSFADLALPDSLLSALAEVGYETPSPIQAACIPHLMEGADLLGEAQTGTGKTAAFALPMLARIDLSKKNPQVLVLTPTRELAIQVAEAFQKYARHLPGFHVLPIYGGQSMVVQLRALSRGAHVVVGTPGRIMDHLERKSLGLADLSAIVLDEADEMLRMGFIDDVEWILKHTPETRQTALFSATMPEAIRRVARTYLREPREVKIKAATATVSAINQRYWQVRGVDKLDALTRILEVEDGLDAAIVFVRTKIATEELAQKLEARGLAAAALNGDMTQGLRERTIDQLKSGTLDIVVATDVAARGIDVPRITHVINYDIPYDTEAYVHRIGRTGRAGRTGVAILFVAPRETRMLRAIEHATKQKIEPISLPSREAVADRRVNQFKELVVETLENANLRFYLDVINQIEEENEFSPHELAAALAYLAQRDKPLQIEEHGKGWDIATQPSKAGAGERPARENRDEILTRRRAAASGALTPYRIAVGRRHGVMPKEIVGAIANEGGIPGADIGQIHLFDDYSTVELPSQLPPDVLDVLRRARVRGQQLDLRPAAPGEADKRGPRGGFGGPREDRGFSERPPRNFDRPQGERQFGERPPRGDRPYGDRPQGDRPQGDRPPRNDRSFGDRGNDRGGFGERPPRSGGFNRDSRPGEGFRRDDNGPRGFGERPPRPAGDRPQGDRPPRPTGDRPARPGGDRPFKSFGNKPFKPRKG